MPRLEPRLSVRAVRPLVSALKTLGHDADAVFPIWDLVFGTFRDSPRDGHEKMQLGLDTRGPEIQRPPWLLASVLRRRP